MIVKRLYSQFRVKFENREDWTFVDYLKDLKQKVNSK
jgi:hypothetical protein